MYQKEIREQFHDQTDVIESVTVVLKTSSLRSPSNVKSTKQHSKSPDRHFSVTATISYAASPIFYTAERKDTVSRLFHQPKNWPLISNSRHSSPGNVPTVTTRKYRTQGISGTLVDTTLRTFCWLPVLFRRHSAASDENSVLLSESEKWSL